MAKKLSRPCPECGETERLPAEPIDRRGALKLMGAGAAVVALSSNAPAKDEKPDRTAEELIKELYGGLSGDQKKDVVLPYDDPKRLRFFNRALNTPIGKAYTKPQQELVQRILRAISSGDEGWKLISRGGTWDASKAFENCGANLFGDISGKYTWVFSGHHLTVRCDGEPDKGPAFGGPLYYGHSPNGYSSRNLFFYQTKNVLGVFDALSEEQRKKAVVIDTPGEGLESVRFRKEGEAKPGIAFGELKEDQQQLVEKVMRDVLSPFRKADADEVMTIVKRNGGMDKVHLAFYSEFKEIDAKKPWDFWRLEGPGFVWNYRVLPHVHTFVNIKNQA